MTLCVVKLAVNTAQSTEKRILDAIIQVDTLGLVDTRGMVSHINSSGGRPKLQLEAPSSPSASPPSSSTITGTTSAPSSTSDVFFLSRLGFRRIIDEKSVQRERIGENKVTDIVSAD